jgi:glycerol-3-phosphate dehydrogenase (NAD(P)+)
MNDKKAIAVLGCGSWGTALAIHLARNEQHVLLWGHDEKEVAALQADRCNTRYLPNINFPENLQVSSDLKNTLNHANDVLIVVPSHAFRSVLQQMKPLLKKDARIAWATKGLDPQSHQLLHVITKEILDDIPSAVLSGPSFAKEVACGLPTAVTVASQTANYAKDLVNYFHNQTFRVYTSMDIAGVELGGAMKNVLAIAVGIADGLNFGANARAALITRGLAEMMRLGLALGAQRETLMGLAGVGDLVLTCTDDQSRNRRFGLAIGKGNNAQETEKNIGQVVEGIRTAKEVFYLAKQYNVEVPICEQVYRVLHEEVTPQAAVSALLSREQRGEGI